MDVHMSRHRNSVKLYSAVSKRIYCRRLQRTANRRAPIRSFISAVVDSVFVLWAHVKCFNGMPEHNIIAIKSCQRCSCCRNGMARVINAYSNKNKETHRKMNHTHNSIWTASASKFKPTVGHLQRCNDPSKWIQSRKSNVNTHWNHVTLVGWSVLCTPEFQAFENESRRKELMTTVIQISKLNEEKSREELEENIRPYNT